MGDCELGEDEDTVFEEEEFIEEKARLCRTPSHFPEAAVFAWDTQKTVPTKDSQAHPALILPKKLVPSGPSGFEPAKAPGQFCQIILLRTPRNYILRVKILERRRWKANRRSS
jgi:hypothetical protein